MALVQYCLLITLAILVSVNIGTNANDVICSEFSDNCFSCVHHGSPCHYVIFDNESGRTTFTFTKKCTIKIIKFFAI